ncbi:hypothetical protein CBR_g30307 [Chara braunii]|uniref:RPN1 N-terminal domain-containing protein n=1 Tax=Chara braunii TaxID=69332 RepID=A0A388JXB3_CHABU|nr:hypothetical protein CBR_g30307 [Chara braunii]|eukprot:GBG62353.1 hypothetical protein CBR_g30307 [Chara braunii]
MVSTDDIEWAITVVKDELCEPADQNSEEDLALKQSLELLVESVKDPEAGVARLAVESMRKEIRSATSSMTSVPKPLKFLRPHYKTLKEYYEAMVDVENKRYLADVISVLAMTMSEEGTRESLKYKLHGSLDDIGSWGHEYVRNLAGEIGQEHQKRVDEEKTVDDLMQLVWQIVPFHVKHGAVPEAVDLLMEVENLDLLIDHIELANYKRTCLYLMSCASYVPEPEDKIVLEIAYKIYRKVKMYPDALRVALRMSNAEHVKSTFCDCEDPVMKKQLAYILARQGFVLNLEDDMSIGDDEREVLQEIISNSKLSEGYLALARDLDVMEAKTPEDIYKAHLLDSRATSGASVDSARQNLAATFVNAFVNAGFGQDKLMTVQSSESSTGTGSGSWLFRNKDHGKTSAAASLVCLSFTTSSSGKVLLALTQTGTVLNHVLSSSSFLLPEKARGGFIGSWDTIDLAAVQIAEQVVVVM